MLNESVSCISLVEVTVFRIPSASQAVAFRAVASKGFNRAEAEDCIAPQSLGTWGLLG